MIQMAFEFWLRGLSRNALITAVMAVNSALLVIFYGINERRAEVLPKPSVHIVGQNLRERLPEMGICTVESVRARTDKGPGILKRELAVVKSGHPLNSVIHGGCTG
jgi:hypothetical protein